MGSCRSSKLIFGSWDNVGIDVAIDTSKRVIETAQRTDVGPAPPRFDYGCETSIARGYYAITPLLTSCSDDEDRPVAAQIQCGFDLPSGFRLLFRLGVFLCGPT